MTAHQRDGARDQADQRVQSQHGGQAYAHDVLHHDEDGNHAQEDEQRRAALTQLREVRTQADGREEHQHERRLQTALEAQRQSRGLMQHEDDGRHDQAAGDRLGNIEVAQKADMSCHELAKHEHKHGHDEGVVRAEGHVHRISWVFHARAEWPAWSWLAIGCARLSTWTRHLLSMVPKTQR